MSVLAIVLIVLVVVVVLFLVGGLVGAGRRSQAHEDDYRRHLREADRALEQARAADRGWDRGILEAAVRAALEDSHPQVQFPELDLVLVDDRPGVEEDRAQFTARAADTEVRVVLVRDATGWAAERID